MLKCDLSVIETEVCMDIRSKNERKSLLVIIYFSLFFVYRVFSCILQLNQSILINVVHDLLVRV